MLSVRSRALVGLLGVLVAGLLGLALAAPASAARTITISLTADGPKPASVTAAVGDTIEFRNDDATFIHQARSASSNWSFDTRPLAPGAKATAGKLTKTGSYLYEGANLDSFTGKVVVPAPTTPSARPPAPAPAPTSSAPAGASPAASPSSTGGTGAAAAPGFGGAGGGLPSPSPSATLPAPQVAPVLPGETPTAAASAGGVLAEPGRLREAVEARRFGLPAALAAVGAVGVASLLLRLLLAQPAARAGRAPRRTA